MPELKTIDGAELRAMSAEQLEAAIRHHNHLYWDRAEPELSDYDYDRLVRRLREVRPDSPVLDELGPSAGELGAEVVHPRPMLSLDKCYQYRKEPGENGESSNEPDLFSWAFVVRRGEVQGEAFAGDVVVTPKMDGIAAALRYDERGYLRLAATRGNGVTGDDITQNALTVADIPRKVDLSGVALSGEDGVEVRGEIYMRLSVFAELSDQFSNPRNLTAGAIKHKDPERCRAYKLSFAAYDLLGTDRASEADKLQALVQLGFPRMEYKVVDKDHLRQGYEHFAAARDELDFEIDGVVFKVNRVDEQQRMGFTAHHPRFAIAYKFQGDVGVTRLNAVEWSVARSGVITPVARIEPVTLSGAQVSRASLHNLNILDNKLGLLGAFPGAMVQVVRSGGVIPKVEEVVRHAEDPPEGAEPIALPERCPSCGGPVRRDADFLFCAQPESCRLAVIGAIAHYCKVVDIQGFGDKLLQQAYDAELLRSPVDLYRLSVEQLLPLERVGQRLAEKLVADVDAHRSLGLATFLRALGIDELGKHVSAILAGRYRTIERVRRVTVEELAAIHTIGEIIARKVVQGLAQKAELVDGLLQEVTLEAPPAAEEEQSGPFAGQSFVFTGKMETLERKEAQQKVKARGGETPSGVTKDLTYLVVGDGAPDKKSSKQKKAEAYNDKGSSIQIISESAFLAMVEE